jgi:hypothetical protein
MGTMRGRVRGRQQTQSRSTQTCKPRSGAVCKPGHQAGLQVLIVPLTSGLQFWTPVRSQRFTGFRQASDQRFTGFGSVCRWFTPGFAGWVCSFPYIEKGKLPTR